jgi:hypothetical protein
MRQRKTFTRATFEIKTAFDHEGPAALVARLDEDSPIVLPAAIPPAAFEE